MDTASLYGTLEMKLKRLVDQDDTVALMSILWFMDNQLKGVAQPERGQAKRQIIKLEPDRSRHTTSCPELNSMSGAALQGAGGGVAGDGAHGDGSITRKRGRPARKSCLGLEQGDSECVACARPELKKRCTYRMASTNAAVIAQADTPTQRQPTRRRTLAAAGAEAGITAVRGPLLDDELTEGSTEGEGDVAGSKADDAQDGVPSPSVTMRFRALRLIRTEKRAARLKSAHQSALSALIADNLALARRIQCLKKG